MTPRSLVAALTVAAALFCPASARAEDPPMVNWAELLPSAGSPGYEPSSEDVCRSGRPGCVDAIIHRMDRSLDRLAERCDHDSIFALSYLRTTEHFDRAVSEAGFFDDPRFITHEAAVFAAYYFDAFEAYHGGHAEEVPPAWRIAFDAATERQVPAAGNLLLGMNAHIQRDRPFVLAAIGLTRPDGRSHKPDNDRVNVFLNRVSDELVPEIARRFDPTVDDANLPGHLDDILTFQIVPAWREIAWRNAERLVAARTDAERAAVATDIEAYAASQAIALRRLSAYLPAVQSSAPRDAWCAEHWDA